MIEPGIPNNEDERLRTLREYDVLDTGPEEAFDDLTRIASRICMSPIALLSLVDAERQWFKSKTGIDATETPRNVSFCGHAILEPDEVFIVPDARDDERFRDNPLVTGDPHVGSYAGAPLVGPDGVALGTLCVIDHRPRDLSESQIEILKLLARQAVVQLELRKKCFELSDVNGRLAVANDRLFRQTEEIQKFYQTLAHELKTPLTAAREFISITKDGLIGSVNPDQVESLGKAQECCDQIKVHVNDLLDLTRLETGKLALHRRTACLGEVISLVVDSLGGFARESEVSIHKMIPEDLPPVDIDPVRLNQVVTNLVNNAIKFSPEKGQVAVSARYDADSDTMVVEVSDTGIGIPEHHLARIFDRLYQVDRDRGGGLGIGLNLSRELVRLHGGDMTVISEPGKGSTFSFHLPVGGGVRSKRAA